MYICPRKTFLFFFDFKGGPRGHDFRFLFEWFNSTPGRGADDNLHHPLWHWRGAFMYTLKLFTFSIYIYNTFWQTFMVVGGGVQKSWLFWYRTLVENQKFLFKTLKNWMCHKIKRLDSFSLKYWHNSHNDDTKILKK